MEKGRNYTKTTFIGEGAYAKVYKAKDEEGNEKYALKEIKIIDERGGIPATCIREIIFLKELRHINIVPLLDILQSQGQITLVFEFVEQDLKKIIDKTLGKGLPPPLVKSLLYQFLKGMSYIHSFKILHRDLKPQNLLINKDNILKIGDFGLARGCGLPSKNYIHKIVTIGYRAPDILLGNENYDKSIDMWSIGCIFAEMSSGRQLFNNRKTNREMLEQIFYIRGTPNNKIYPLLDDLPKWKYGKFHDYPEKDIREYVPNLDEDGIDLLLKMIQIDPDKRIDCDTALKHKYFNDISPSIVEMYEDDEDEYKELSGLK